MSKSLTQQRLCLQATGLGSASSLAADSFKSPSPVSSRYQKKFNATALQLKVHKNCQIFGLTRVHNCGDQLNGKAVSGLPGFVVSQLVVDYQVTTACSRHSRVFAAYKLRHYLYPDAAVDRLVSSVITSRVQILHDLHGFGLLSDFILHHARRRFNTITQSRGAIVRKKQSRHQYYNTTNFAMVQFSLDTFTRVLASNPELCWAFLEEPGYLLHNLQSLSLLFCLAIANYRSSTLRVNFPIVSLVSLSPQY